MALDEHCSKGDVTSVSVICVKLWCFSLVTVWLSGNVVRWSIKKLLFVDTG